MSEPSEDLPRGRQFLANSHATVAGYERAGSRRPHDTPAPGPTVSAIGVCEDTVVNEQ